MTQFRHKKKISEKNKGRKMNRSDYTDEKINEKIGRVLDGIPPTWADSHSITDLAAYIRELRDFAEPLFERQLLPCPFCGSEDVETDNSDLGKSWWVECLACMARSASWSEELEAIESWNRRAGEKENG